MRHSWGDHDGSFHRTQLGQFLDKMTDAEKAAHQQMVTGLRWLATGLRDVGSGLNDCQAFTLANVLLTFASEMGTPVGEAMVALRTLMKMTTLYDATVDMVKAYHARKFCVVGSKLFKII